MKLVAVIPAYNEAATIRDVASRTLGFVRDVIVVDDGSIDGTAAQTHGLGVTLVSNPRNLGKGASLARGFAIALAEGADAVVTLDGDAQHCPEDIPRLVDTARAHPGRIIIGARECGTDSPAIALLRQPLRQFLRRGRPVSRWRTVSRDSGSIRLAPARGDVNPARASRSRARS
jgi:glycosyltransferase involved in cell wall biosynthesis